MTNTDLDEIEKRLRAATPGPWYFEYDGSGDYHIYTHAFEQRGDRDIAHLWRSYTDTGKYFKDGDAEFIAHSITDVERLLKAYRVMLDALEGNCHAPDTGESGYDYIVCGKCPSCVALAEIEKL